MELVVSYPSFEDFFGNELHTSTSPLGHHNPVQLQDLMQFVAYDSDSENDGVAMESVKSAGAPAPAELEVQASVSEELPAEWLNADDSCSDEESTQDPSTLAQSNQAAGPTKRLADFDTLLSAVSEKPKFLKKKIDEDVFFVPETKSHHYDVADKDYTESRHQGRGRTEGKSAAPPVRVPASIGRANVNSREAAGGGNKLPQGQDKETAKVCASILARFLSALKV